MRLLLYLGIAAFAFGVLGLLALVLKAVMW